MFLLFYRKGGKFWPSSAYHRIMLCLNGLFGSLTVLTAFVSVKFMPVPDAITLIFTAPLFTMVLAALFLKDKLTVIKVISGMTLMVGIVLVTQPTFLFEVNHNVLKGAWKFENEFSNSNQDEKNTSQLDAAPHDRDSSYLLGAMVALSSALFSAIVCVITSKIGNNVPTTLQLLYIALFSLSISCFLPCIDNVDYFFRAKIVDITALNWGLYVGLSLSGMFSYRLAFKACKMIQPAIVATLRTTEIVIAFIAQSILNSFSVTYYLFC